MNSKTRFPHTPTASFTLLAASLLILLGCSDLQPAAQDDASAADAAPTTAPADATLDAAEAPAAAGGAVSANGITYTLPEGWRGEQPDSPMRMGQATIPGPGGDGLLTVFFFGPGGGGSAEMNIQRWVDQMTADAGATPVTETVAQGDFVVSFVEHQGTLQASRMGTFPSTDMPGYRLLGAVVEGPGGPWFFKAVGPDATLAAERDAFRSMILGVQLAG